MMRAKHLLLAAGLLGGLMMAVPASAVPAGPSGLDAAPAPVVQARMTRGERMMMRDRMMRKRMMRHRMMRHHMMRRRMMRDRM